jgi:hypothetical protein
MIRTPRVVNMSTIKTSKRNDLRSAEQGAKNAWLNAMAGPVLDPAKVWQAVMRYEQTIRHYASLAQDNIVRSHAVYE